MSDIHSAQCGNDKIFLSLRFNVKSISADFGMSKTGILTILDTVTFDFWQFYTRNCQKIPKIHNPGLVKW